MTKNIKPVQKETFQFSQFKHEIFKDITPVELLTVVNQMQEDLLCSSITDDDTNYRNEIIVATRVLTQMIIGIHKEMNPNKIHVMELIF